MTKHTTDARNKNVVEWYRKGLSLEDIAEMFNICPGHVERLLSIAGVAGFCNPERARQQVKRENMIVELWQAGKTSVYISEVVKLSPQGVMNTLRRIDRELRALVGRKKLKTLMRGG